MTTTDTLFITALQDGNPVGSLLFSDGASKRVAFAGSEERVFGKVELEVYYPFNFTMLMGGEIVHLLPPVRGWKRGEIVAVPSSLEVPIEGKKLSLVDAKNSFVIPCFTENGMGFTIRIGLVFAGDRHYLASQISTRFAVRSTVGRLSLPDIAKDWPELEDYYNLHFPDRMERAKFGQLCRWKPAPKMDLSGLKPDEGIVKFTTPFRGYTIIATKDGDVYHPRQSGEAGTDSINYLAPGTKVTLKNVTKNTKGGGSTPPLFTSSVPKPVV